MNFCTTLVLSFFIASGIWEDIGTDQTSIAKRAPSLFFACVSQGIVASLQGINSFPAERAIILRERAAGSYHISAYFMARTITDLLTQLWPPILFTVIVYPTIGYQNDPEKFLTYMVFMILDTYAATSLSAAGMTLFCICVSLYLLTTNDYLLCSVLSLYFSRNEYCGAWVSL